MCCAATAITDSDPLSVHKLTRAPNLSAFMPTPAKREGRPRHSSVTPQPSSVLEEFSLVGLTISARGGSCVTFRLDLSFWSVVVELEVIVPTW